MDNYNFVNKQILDVQTRVVGHIHELSIRLIFDNCVIYINPKRSWFSDDGKRMPLYELFDCFDIDCEDGANFEDLKGCYCRLAFDNYRKVIAIYHIIKDKYVLLEDLK